MKREAGMALVVATMAMALLGALAAALALVTASEAQIAANFRVGQQAFYAADAAIEWTLADLPSVPDWALVAAGASQSRFVDGAPTGTRALSDGTVVDLDGILAANPDWHPYAFGRLADLLPASGQPSAFYICVLVSPDEVEGDRLKVRAEALGPRGARRMVDAVVSRGAAGARLESWSLVR